MAVSLGLRRSFVPAITRGFSAHRTDTFNNSDEPSDGACMEEFSDYQGCARLDTLEGKLIYRVVFHRRL